MHPFSEQLLQIRRQRSLWRRLPVVANADPNVFVYAKAARSGRSLRLQARLVG